jgi:superfamily II DNA or RNA helicase
MKSLFDNQRILDLGPHEFRRSVQRVMIQNGFDAFSVDGAGDGGGDLFCEKNGERWIIQCKSKKSGLISPKVIDEILSARFQYGAHKSVIATNQRISDSSKKKLKQLVGEGLQIDIWEGSHLLAICEKSPRLLSGKELRPYQSEAVRSVQSGLKEKRRALIFLATGLGKTVVAGRVIREHLQNNPTAKILVLAHMVDLVEQLQRALWSDIDLFTPSQIIDGSSKPNDLSGLTVATDKGAYPYIHNGYRPDLVVIDECHHVGEDNLYSKIMDELGDTPILGVTATPWRGDGFSIEQAFGPASFLCGIEDGLRKGYLAPVKYKLYCDNINWDLIPTLSKYEYTVKQLNRKLFIPQRDESVVDALLDVWSSVVDAKAIIFCQSIQHAEIMCSLVKKHDMWREAELVHSGMDKQARRMAIINFRSKGCPMLIAVDILNEGVDIPNVNIVCFVRVTHSRKIFIQQLGRGLRLAPGKEELVVLDFAADARRLAAITKLNNAMSNKGDLENLQIAKNVIEFSDKRAKTLIDEWILDAADLETALDESKLQFPETS